MRLHRDAWPFIRNEITTVWVTHPGEPINPINTIINASTTTSLTNSHSTPTPSISPLLSPEEAATSYQVTIHLWSYNSLSLPKVKHSPTIEIHKGATIADLRAKLVALYPSYSVTGRFVKVDVMQGKVMQGGTVHESEQVTQEHYQVYFRDLTRASRWFW
jgi:hypothetical protein